MIEILAVHARDRGVGDKRDRDHRASHALAATDVAHDRLDAIDRDRDPDAVVRDVDGDARRGRPCRGSARHTPAGHARAGHALAREEGAMLSVRPGPTGYSTRPWYIPVRMRTNWSRTMPSCRKVIGA